MSDRDLLGMLYLDSRQQRGKLTRIDSDLLKTIATEAAVLVENTSLAHAEEAARHYREELTIAADIQRGIDGGAHPEMPYARVHANSISCKEVGGDFYDVLEVENGLYVIIADISGKGISGGLARLDLARAGACADHGRTAAGEDRYDCQPVHLREESSKVRDPGPAEAYIRWGAGIHELWSRAAAVTNVNRGHSPAERELPGGPDRWRGVFLRNNPDEAW